MDSRLYPQGRGGVKTKEVGNTLQFLDADGVPFCTFNADSRTVDFNQQVKTLTALFGPAATEELRFGGIGDPFVLIAQSSQGTSTAWMNTAFATDRAQLAVQLEDDGRVYLIAADELYISSVGDFTIDSGEIADVDIFSLVAELLFTPTGGAIKLYGALSGEIDILSMTSGDHVGDLKAVLRAGVIFPSADPHLAGEWYDNAGTLTKSLG